MMGLFMPIIQMLLKTPCTCLGNLPIRQSISIPFLIAADFTSFFCENVGISAWGLAVHSASRLIAVSSNHHEITVFAFGLNPSAETVYEAESPSNPGSTPQACSTGRDSVFDANLTRPNKCLALLGTNITFELAIEQDSASSMYSELSVWACVLKSVGFC